MKGEQDPTVKARGKEKSLLKKGVSPLKGLRTEPFEKMQRGKREISCEENPLIGRASQGASYISKKGGTARRFFSENLADRRSGTRA